MRVHVLGHVVLKVRDLRRSETFYSGVLGMAIVSRISDPVRMTFFTLGNHHDFALMEICADAPSPGHDATGLAHVAFKIGDTLDEFRSVKSDLDAAGVPILYEPDRALTKSVHVRDPDGNEIELYIDNADTWKTNTRHLAAPNSSRPHPLR